MKIASVAAAVLCLGLVQAYAASPGPAAPPGSDSVGVKRIWMTFNARRFAISLHDNEAARAFAAQLPLTLDMPDLNGNEKHAKLRLALAQAAVKPGTIHAGDLMLWGADTLVVFYATFDSPYAYTRIGAIEDGGALAQVLGDGTARLTFSRN